MVVDDAEASRVDVAEAAMSSLFRPLQPQVGRSVEHSRAGRRDQQNDDRCPTLQRRVRSAIGRHLRTDRVEVVFAFTVRNYFNYDRPPRFNESENS